MGFYAAQFRIKILCVKDSNWLSWTNLEFLKIPSFLYISNNFVCENRNKYILMKCGKICKEYNVQIVVYFVVSFLN